MQPQNDKIIRELHQKASEHYLAGEFQDAVETWRQILLLDPQNEDALEGVGLCEFLDESGSAEAPPAPDAQQPPANLVDPKIDEGLEQSLQVMDEILEVGELEAGSTPFVAAETPQAVATVGDFKFDLSELSDIDLQDKGATEDPDRQGPGIDLGDLGGIEPLAIEGTSLTDPAPGGSPATDSASDAASRSSELQSRVEGLICDACSAWKIGDLDEALDALAKALALDESSEAAQALVAQIRAERDGGGDEAAVFEALPVHDAEPQDEDLDFGEAIEPQSAPQVDMAPPTQAIEDSAGPPQVEYPRDEVFGTPAPDPEPRQPRSRRSSTTSRKLLLLVGLPVVVLAAAAAFFLGGGSGSGQSEAPAAAGSRPPAAASAAPAASTIPGAGQQPRTGAAPAPAPTEAPPAAAPTESLESILSRGNTALRTGDYATAVVAFGQVLRIEPDHVEAGRNLQLAATRYRDSQELALKWEKAVLDFRRGAYRSALTAFYRMPGADADPRLKRYVLNGWYNMALQSLAGADCRQAYSHFQEAAAIDASDAGVRQGLALTRGCKSDRTRLPFDDWLRDHPYRKLED